MMNGENAILVFPFILCSQKRIWILSNSEYEVNEFNLSGRLPLIKLAKKIALAD